MRSETPGPLAHAGSLRLGMGGAEGNVAVGLARLGTSVTWIGRVGADSLGDLVIRELTAEGIAVVGHRDQQAPTGLMIRESRIQDSAKVWYYRAGSAGSRLEPGDIPGGQIAEARLLHLTGITSALSATAAAAVDYALDCARSGGTLVSLDLNYRAALWPPETAGPAFRRLIARADLVFAGEEEAAVAVAVGAAAGVQELAERIAALGPSQVIIKRGAAGCLGLINGVIHERSAIAVRPIDTVGAGDAFVAGYLAELLAGEPVPVRLLTAVRTGAFACLVPGDWEGLPRRSELELLEGTDPVRR